MSRQQWGHGYYSGLRAAKKQQIKLESFPVGFFFHVRDEEDHQINKQGIVTAKSGDTFLVKYFNWIDGGMGNKVYPVTPDDMKDWDFYESAEDMQKAYDEQTVTRMIDKGWNADDAERTIQILRGELPE